MNQDLALIYNTNGILNDLEKVAGAPARRVTLMDLAVDLASREGGEPDLEKVSEIHAFLVEADGLGRSYAQSKFSELEEAYLAGDEDAASSMREFFGEEKTAGFGTWLGRTLNNAGKSYGKRLAAAEVATTKALKAGVKANKGKKLSGLDTALTKLKTYGREFLPEVGAAGVAGAGLAGAGYLAGSNNRSVTVRHVSE